MLPHFVKLYLHTNYNLCHVFQIIDHFFFHTQVRTVAKRDSYAAGIRALHATAGLGNNDATMAPQLLVASAKLDELWARFQVEDNVLYVSRLYD